MVGGGIAAALLACQIASRAVHEDNEQEPAMYRGPINTHPNFGCATAMPYRCETATCGYIDTKEDLYY